ncbi:MAG: T9SS type A sorting domain-containing protein [Ignavibacteria bacterium]|jgi:photosystem II stability/assembly factor-like uncharacterized protein|nr:T9SS type A sorting domain-containing protein [Ignavibacteria bacterium]
MRKKNIICLLLFSTLNFSLLTFNSFGQWIQQSVPVTTGSFLDMKFANTNTGFISHSTDKLLKTTNAGYNWFINYYARILSLCTIIDSCIYGVGLDNTYFFSRLYKSNNYGNTWDSLLSTATYTYHYLHFFNRDTGLISGSNSFDNLIWRTTDGGQTKQLMSTISISGVGKFNFVKEKVNGEYYGYLYYPQDRYLYYTSNSGVSWQYRQFLPIAVNSIYFINKDTGWATASTSVNYVMKTVDGGLNWVNQTVPYGVTNYDIYFADSQKGWIGCSHAQKIYVTTNGGNNWGTQTLYGGASFILCFLDSLTGWAQTSLNTIAHTTNGGGPITSAISNNIELSNDYMLYHNYPNPFNSTTNIKYEISKKGYVRIILFDILGNKIKTLVNKNQESGIYEILFDAGSLSSGIYFYRITAEGYTETKKMIYMK